MLAVQETQDGTGHAVRVAWEALDPADRTGTVLVAYGDTPLLEGESLRAFAEDHVAAGRGGQHPLRASWPNPFGYGRVLRDESGEVTGIVEQKDATAEQAAVTEINSGILAFDADFLDARAAAADQRQRQRASTTSPTPSRSPARTASASGAFAIDDVLQTEGANDRAQLAALAKEKNRRILDPLDARRRDDHRPRHHLDRRRRAARAATSRSCPACSCSARPSSRRTPWSARTARSRTSRSAPARASYAPTASSP